MKLNRIFIKGLLFDNPVFIQLLGMCPVLAVTNTAENSLFMGMATTAVLLGSNIVISLLKKFIPTKIRIPIFIVVIATFVTIVGMVLNAYFPAIHANLGIFIPLIVVNCLILARAESFASKSSTVGSVVDGLGMGIGFTIALFVLGSVREVLGYGTFYNIALFGDGFQPATIMAMPPGAFLALGLLMGLFNKIISKNVNEL
ncbi:electron transport complex subunit E [Serpentinicella sp. ANB-PHB4]|uniref:electron transport complex subunit E n=1 Tax=Serpentinicella sp. ANB-PHB4 TaxID=3074076 RepID=UPI002857FDDA|nr:electron transport complex subunit E [Serpentinicella sp. ANB-PHB4]MDR5657880.1 electron transport complex subunit E [Serpentinicella sp. ANB-PHB4]